MRRTASRRSDRLQSYIDISNRIIRDRGVLLLLFHRLGDELFRRIRQSEIGVSVEVDKFSEHIDERFMESWLSHSSGSEYSGNSGFNNEKTKLISRSRISFLYQTAFDGFIEGTTPNSAYFSDFGRWPVWTQRTRFFRSRFGKNHQLR